MTELPHIKNNSTFDSTNLSRHPATHKLDNSRFSVTLHVIEPCFAMIFDHLRALVDCWAKNNPLAMKLIETLTWQLTLQILTKIGCFESAELVLNEPCNSDMGTDTTLNLTPQPVRSCHSSEANTNIDTIDLRRERPSESEDIELHLPTLIRLDKRILEERFLAVPKNLAAHIGMAAAAILQEFHSLTVQGYGKLVNGVRWLWNSRQDWVDKFFSCLSQWEFRKGINKLKALGLIKVRQLEKSKWDHTNHYAIDYEKLKALPLPIGEPSPIGWRTLTNRLVTAHQSYRTENSPEKTSKTTTNAASLKFNQESSPDLSASLKNSVKAVNEELEIPAAALKSSQESSPDLSASLESSVEAVSEELKITVEDQCSAAPTEDKKIEIVEGAGIAMNPHLIRTLTNFTLEQVKAAVSHYQAVIAKGTQINNSAGWLSQCLKGEWWKQSKAPEATYAYSNVITAADQEKVEAAPMPTDFSNMLKAVKQKVKQELSRSRTKSLGFA